MREGKSIVTHIRTFEKERRGNPLGSFAILQAAVGVPSHPLAATPPHDGERTLGVANTTTCCAAAWLERPGDRGTGANDHRRESRSQHR